MATNIDAFDLAIERHHQRRIPDRMRDQADAVGLGLLGGVMEDTPVRTGLMKGNWQLTTGQPATGSISRTDTSARGTIGSAYVEESRKLDRPRDPFAWIWLHNGLDYAAAVNSGTETQAAQRIVERTADRFRRTAASAR